MNREYSVPVFIGSSFLALAFMVGVMVAQDKAPAAKTPTLTDTQRIALLQAEVKVLTSQVENLQAQVDERDAKLKSMDKDKTFKATLSDLYKQAETTAKEAGADNSDLDLNSLTFKERPKPPVPSAPVVTPAAPVKK